MIDLNIPKYHCELNFIERLWGYLKGRVRKECDYSFPSLCERVPKAIENIPINFVQKSFRMCFRIMDMYNFGQGLEGPLLDYANRKYKSHRRVPLTLNIDELKQEYATYEKKLLTKREQSKKK